MEQQAFREARRELGGVTAAAEKRLLVWLGARMPAWVTPDHLTALGLAAMAAAGLAYALSRRDPRWIHAVNLCLLLNWFGDSLDGTLARVRQKLRPRYGFYVDHLVDAFGALFLLLGLAASGLMAERVAAALLVTYYLLNINIYLATYTLGTFKISYGAVGGTELRLLLIVANLLALWLPEVSLLGAPRRLFDLIGLFGTAGLAVTVLRSAAWCTRTLYQLERV
ncbi:MAG TPA: CDP-alcohol phosphatidyltransferase family protein [Methylomirabilota bacterium]|nr:CDP-alcohol phosphatidyltransferase family protein [Methylomirabilota bacterium]